MRKRYLVGLALCLALCLAACGGEATLPEEPTPVPAVDFSAGSFPADSEEIAVALSEGETALLERLPRLRRADLTGSECYEEIAQYRDRHPEVELICPVALPDGSVLPPDTSRVDLSGLSRREAMDCLARLRLLPALEEIDLGERSEEPGALTWEEVGAFQAAYPDCRVNYRFRLFDKAFSTLDERMILSHRRMDDQGAAVREVLPYMTRCTFLDMDSCGVDNEHMAAIRDAYPGMKVVWRVWFGDVYTCRTDVTRLLASSEGHILDDQSSEGLYYCTDVVYMDIGHSQLKDLSFLYNMPGIEVLIVACAPWTDATPIGSLENLEYLEVLSTSCGDISSFANLHKLKHLNIGNCSHITDITPLYGLTQLERLWIGCMTPVPQEQKDKIRELLPDTLINTTTVVHKSEGWCKDETAHNVPRYALLREQFGDYQASAYAYDWADILYKKSLDELTEEELLLVKP